MSLDLDTCYEALKARDARFDGRFFVAVRSTNIYCRPVCPARTPLKVNVDFFVHAAGAERAGYRPCLRCRPELAPGLAPMDAPDRVAQLAAARIEADIDAIRHALVLQLYSPVLWVDCVNVLAANGIARLM